MKNIEVNNDTIAHGFEEAAKVIDHYVLSGWIVPCPKCGTWLTSLGLCPDCGVRFEVVESTMAIDRDLMCRIARHVYVDGVCSECGRVEAKANDAIDWKCLDRALGLTAHPSPGE